jgi:hypothetical protein
VVQGLPADFPPLKSLGTVASETRSALSDYVLSWTDARGTTGRRELPQGELHLGRVSSCDIVLNDAEVSRNHALLRIDRDTVSIRDLGSRNGTFVNGQQVTNADLNPGDEIKLGNSVLYLLAPGLEQTRVPGITPGLAGR